MNISDGLIHKTAEDARYLNGAPGVIPEADAAVLLGRVIEHHEAALSALAHYATVATMAVTFMGWHSEVPPQLIEQAQELARLKQTLSDSMNEPKQ